MNFKCESRQNPLYYATLMDIGGTTCHLDYLSKEDRFTFKHNKLVIEDLGGRRFGDH